MFIHVTADTQVNNLQETINMTKHGRSIIGNNDEVEERKVINAIGLKYLRFREKLLSKIIVCITH